MYGIAIEYRPKLRKSKQLTSINTTQTPIIFDNVIVWSTYSISIFEITDRNQHQNKEKHSQIM